MSKSFQKQVMRTSNARAKNVLATLFISLSAVSANAFADTSLSIEPYKATYTAYKWGDDVGQASIELSQLGEEKYSLIYTSKVSKFFLSDKRSEHSIFLIQGDNIVPSEYYYSRSGTGPDKSLEVSFSHQGNGKITVDNGNAFEWDGEFDNQIYRLDLAKQLAKGETSLTYDFINYRGQRRQYGVEVVDNETLKLPYGDLKTVKVKLIRDSKKRETFAWFAPSLDYALVRLQQFKEGEEQGDIKLKAFETL
ncbi:MULTISPECIES: DUF3108 domain-containing protein [Alteromonas]|uniref:DUF3108 domain-containing protein n=1 Tax=Alteromonas TaxID=226 RepID=UPI000C66D6AB|nr:DUF3108 domain-containing protein [Alteromonas sp.]MAI39110.1 hypothetical protein [Alteromonas sp.]